MWGSCVLLQQISLSRGEKRIHVASKKKKTKNKKTPVLEVKNLHELVSLLRIGVLYIVQFKFTCISGLAVFFESKLDDLDIIG